MMTLKWEKPEVKDLNDLQKVDGSFCNEGTQVDAGDGNFDCYNGGAPVGCAPGNSPVR